MFDTFCRIFLTVGGIGTLIGAWLAYRTLKANHDWARRRYAIDMLGEWNRNVYGHFRAIEQLYPHIRQLDQGEKKYMELSHDEAKRLWACDPDDCERWRVKTAMMELLNYFEFITTAYSQNVADGEIVEASFRSPLIQWHDTLTSFIRVAEKGLGFQPWQPFLNVVAAWKAPAPRERGKTA